MNKKIKSFANSIIQPTIIALGSSIFLYAYNDNLRFVDYFTHIPFWICFVKPSGLYWNQVLISFISKSSL